MPACRTTPIFVKYFCDPHKTGFLVKTCQELYVWISFLPISTIFSPKNCPINNPLHILAPPPVLFQIFLWKGFKYKQFPAQKIIQIQNVSQCSVANNECLILLNIHYLIQQINNLEFFCMRIPLNFSSFFVLKTLKKYNILCGFSQDFYFTLIMAPFNLWIHQR